MPQDESEIDAREASDRRDAGALFLDVREDFEWDAGHIEGARHVPLGTLGQAVDALPKDRPIVVLCKVGGRSAQATAYLQQQGFDAVNLAGGMFAWEAAALPFVDNEGQPGSIA
jgi:rhodanese-related sulfurtransferase